MRDRSTSFLFSFALSLCRFLSDRFQISFFSGSKWKINELSCIFKYRQMANSNPRNRFSFLDLAHPQFWTMLVEYSELTVTLAKLSSFNWFRDKILFRGKLICIFSDDVYDSMGKNLFLSSIATASISKWFSSKNWSWTSWKVSRSTGKKEENCFVFVIRCLSGGRMYDLWESLLLESEIESQVRQKRKEHLHLIFFLQVIKKISVSDGKRDQQPNGDIYECQKSTISHFLWTKTKSQWDCSNELRNSSRCEKIQVKCDPSGRSFLLS